MIIEEMNKCIIDMQTIQQLEQASKDSEKQDKIDSLFSATVIDNDKIIKLIDSARSYVSFVPSLELKDMLRQILNDALESTRIGAVQDASIKYLQGKIKSAKEQLATEWGDYYSLISEKIISTLGTVKEITPDREKTGFVINNIKNGAVISYENSDRMRLLSEGLKNANTILDSLGLTEEIMLFLDKVSEGNANVTDLSDSILEWIRSENLINKFVIAFN